MLMPVLKRFSRFRDFQQYLTGASLKVIHNDPTHSVVLVRPLLLRLPVAACLQASVATGNLSMGGGRNEVCEGEPSSSGELCLSADGSSWCSLTGSLRVQVGTT